MKTSGMIELHCHTKMSAWKGLIEPKELIQHAYENGYKAIAITDCGNVQAFPEAYKTWKRLWEEHKKECMAQGKEPDQANFLKVIYGLEGYLTDDYEKSYPILIYARNETGIRNLYKIVTASHLEYFDKIPLIPRKLLDDNRDGLLLGSVNDGGEVYEAIHSDMGNRGDAEYIDDFKRILSYYDFCEVSLSASGPDERYIYHVMKYGGVLVATSDAYYINEDEMPFWDMLTSRTGGKQDGRYHHLIDYVKEKRAYGCWSEGCPDELKKVPTEVIKNQSFVADQIDYVSPLREGRFIPDYPDADNELKKICEDKAKSLYGDELPKEVKIRLNLELEGICQHGYSSIIMYWRSLVCESDRLGYPVCSRGAVASSLVAYLCGITKINPLPKGFGGFNIPIETFLGLGLDKEPDIDMNFSPEIRDRIQNYVRELPDIGEICHGGTIAKLRNNWASLFIQDYCRENQILQIDSKRRNELSERIEGVKKGDGMHPAAVFICPTGEELSAFTPLQHPYMSKEVVSQFDYHVVSENLLRLDILALPELSILNKLHNMTGFDPDNISLNDDQVLQNLCDPEPEVIPGIIKMGTETAREVIRDVGPSVFGDLVKVVGIIHGMDVWDGNQRELVKEKKIRFQDCIGTRDDIFLLLLERGGDKKTAFEIMESVRKGKGLNTLQENLMRKYGIDEWYIEVCRKIKWLLPKAHAVSYTLLAWQLAYYRTFYPEQFSEVLSKV